MDPISYESECSRQRARLEELAIDFGICEARLRSGELTDDLLADLCKAMRTLSVRQASVLQLMMQESQMKRMQLAESKPWWRRQALKFRTWLKWL